ncbi:glycosyltransferase [Flavobacterium flavipallidum]|uniref:Nucleotidyltransferase n=1 Tax=Flavobacterium flavipallidum TaxID=3139140 RepID=A0ABU9HJ56_9FLAO
MFPTISIIVPNYNHAPFLKQRLESVFNQTYKDFEVIILDDCSTDNSREILLEYAQHPKVSHCVLNKVNSRSPFKQWQKGIALAKGEYIWIAESDDYCELDFLENLTKVFLPDTVLAYCKSINVDKNGKTLGLNDWAVSFDKMKWATGHINEGKNEIKNYMRYRNCIPNASAVLFKKSAVDTVFFHNDFYYCGDWFFWLQLLQKGSVAYCNLPLNFFRRHTLTTRSIKNYLEEKKRFNEYTIIVKRYSSIRSRMFNFRKYMWIVQEWLTKSSNFKFTQAITINMPFPLGLIFIQKYLKLKLKK